MQSFRELLFDGFVYLNRFLTPPVQVVQFAAEVDKIIYVARFKFIDYMFTEIDTRNPAIFDVLKPLFVITVVRRMKVEYIFTNQDKLIDTGAHHEIDHLALE